MQPHAPARAVPDWVFVVLLALAGAWAVLVTVLANSVAWFVQEILGTDEINFPAYVWPLIALGTALLAAAAVVPLAVFVRRARLRAVAQTWALALVCLPVLGVLRALSLPHAYAAVLEAVVTGALAVVVLLAHRRRVGRGGALAGSLVGLVLVLPWTWAGALGSAYDVAADALLAAALGALGGAVLAGRLWPAFAATPAPRWQQVLAGAPAAGVAVTILASGAGPVRTHLLLMLILPTAAMALAVLAATGRRGPAAGSWLLGLAALGPLAFADPAELTVLLGFHDVGEWAAVAGIASALLALALFGLLWTGAALAPRRPRPGPRTRRVLAGSAAAMLVAAGGGIAVASGQAGFYGEHLFVVLADQATPAASAADSSLTERRERIYSELVAHAEVTQRPLRAALTERGASFTPYYLVNGLEVADTPGLRSWLAGRSDVAKVLDVPRLRPLPVEPQPDEGDISQPPTYVPWGIAAIGAYRAHDELGVDGRGVVVGVADSGVDGSHPALRGSYRGITGGDDYNWYDPWNHTKTPTDIGGHGTHTTATAVGRFVGVAPGAQWIGCVNLARNLGSVVRYLDCLQFLLAPFPQGGNPFRDGKPSMAADVLNNSWGCPELEGCTPDALGPATRALKAAGIFVVVSAGNSGPRCGSVTDPLALYSDVLTVGASDRHGEIASFSSRGPVDVDRSHRTKPDLIAPGVDVLSALPGGTYGTYDGTSMAGPHVVGVVALMWQANPALKGDIDRTAELLRSTAKPVTTTSATCGGTKTNVVGAGIVDAYAAVAAARAG